MIIICGELWVFNLVPSAKMEGEEFIQQPATRGPMGCFGSIFIISDCLLKA